MIEIWNLFGIDKEIKYVFEIENDKRRGEQKSSVILIINSCLAGIMMNLLGTGFLSLLDSQNARSKCGAVSERRPKEQVKFCAFLLENGNSDQRKAFIEDAEIDRKNWEPKRDEIVCVWNQTE